MNILIINSGSSSIKYQLFDMPSKRVVCAGAIERIGSHEAVFTYKAKDVLVEEKRKIPTHKRGLQEIADMLRDTHKGVIKMADEIHAVGHRVVHGGNRFSETTLINKEVKEKISAFSTLAPLHNPANLEGIVLAEEIFPKAKQVAVFDTAFHQTMPEKVKKYAIPTALFTEHGIQAYGFHGTSHKYVSERAQEYLNLNNPKLISIHLGNGCSMTAIKNGKSVDHSMGFAPSNGLIMGTRSGDIDHSIVFHLTEQLGYGQHAVKEMLLKKSGLLGLTGYNDLRDIQAKAEKGDTDCILALEMSAYRIKKYIGAYAAAMNGLDAILFTAGIGENSSILRKMVCQKMTYFGIELDDSKNESRSSGIREINTASSKVKILVVPTNEELEIAQQTFALCGKLGKGF